MNQKENQKQHVSSQENWSVYVIISANWRGMKARLGEGLKRRTQLTKSLRKQKPYASRNGTRRLPREKFLKAEARVKYFEKQRS
jgi:hypothetical protein